MSKQTINIGASPNDGTGTPLRTSFDYTNQNFTELYTALGGGVGLPGATTQVIFNDGGTNLAGDAGLVFNKTTDALTIAGPVNAASAAITGAATVGTTLGVTGNLTVGTNALIVFPATNRVLINQSTAIQGSPLEISALSSGADTLSLFGRVIDNGSAITFRANGAATNKAQIIGDDTGFKFGTAGVTRYTIDTTGVSTWSISGTTAMTLNSTANLVLKGGTVGATGVGVTFPATQVASSDANCLDDYVESTFSPTIVGSTTAGTATYSLQTGRATKIGRLVTFSLRVAYSAGSGTGNLRVGNLPFTAGVSSVCAIYAENIALTAGNYPVCSVSSGNTFIGIDQLPTGGGAASAVPYDVAGDIQISGSYIV